MRTESVSVACGVWAGSLEGLRVACRCAAIPDDDEPNRERSGVASVAEGVELRLGAGLMLLEGLAADVESAEGLLDCDWISRRRAAMRSTMDCRPIVLRSELLGTDCPGVGAADAPAPIRLPMLLDVFEPALPLRGDGKDLSLKELRLCEPIVPPMELFPIEGVRVGAGVENDGRDGVERIDGAGRLGATEVLGRLGLIGGLGRLNDGLGRLGLMDGLGRLIDGLGAADGARLDIRFSMPPLGALGLGADGAIGEGPRLIRGLGAELNDREPIDPPGLGTEGREGIRGAARILGAALRMLGREATPLELLRPRNWPCACGGASRAIPTTTAVTAEPQTRRLGRADSAAREWFLWSIANIATLLSSGGSTTGEPLPPHPADRRHPTRPT